MTIIQGHGASAGVTCGPLYLFRRPPAPVYADTAEDPGAEWARFKAAQTRASLQLAGLARRAMQQGGQEAADLFETHQLLAEDLDFEDAIQRSIRLDGLTAEAAVNKAAEQFARMFREMDDAYMQARSDDILDVGRRILRILSGRAEGRLELEWPVILVSDELAPSETIQLDKSKILAFVTEGGSANSHSAILARTMGIPAVFGAEGLLRPEYEGQEAFVDGETGQIVLDADDETRDSLLEKQQVQARLAQLLHALKGQPNRTLDGRELEVVCNISGPGDLPAVRANDGSGVGLLRSELLYLQSTVLPGEEEQLDFYRSVLEPLHGQRAVIRTLDIGADKQVDYLPLPAEENPALGMRAVRLCLTRPDLFRVQLRALYRASAYGNLAILFPMVSSPWEFTACRALCEQVQRELTQEGVAFCRDVPLGVMIETPAAAMMSEELARVADFFSVGTNDLTQYTLACDRQSGQLDQFYDPHHPAVLRMIRRAAKAIHRHGKWIGICGELAGDVQMTELFVAMGIDELSVSPSQVLPVRNTLRSLDSRVNGPRLLEELGE